MESFPQQSYHCLHLNSLALVYVVQYVNQLNDNVLILLTNPLDHYYMISNYDDLIEERNICKLKSNDVKDIRTINYGYNSFGYVRRKLAQQI